MPESVRSFWQASRQAQSQRRGSNFDERDTIETLRKPEPSYTKPVLHSEPTRASFVPLSIRLLPHLRSYTSVRWSAAASRLPGWPFALCARHGILQGGLWPKRTVRLYVGTSNT